MKDFEFHAPSSLDEAVSALEGNGGAKVLAGGMSLLPVMKLGLAEHEHLVSLGGLPGLAEIREVEGGVEVGATCTHAAVSASAVVQDRIPALARLAGHIGDAQVRNRGTIGGSIAHNDPAADYPAACLALGATIVTNRREISADDFFRGMFDTALDDHEIITAVRFPAPRRAAYAKFPDPASKYAVVGVMVADTSDGVRVAVTGAGESGVFRVSEMEEALGADFSPSAVSGISVPDDGLLSDNTAGRDYRAHLVTVMAKRAVEACA
jgi:carbon-monoxide dehydrogenase medium subunit